MEDLFVNRRVVFEFEKNNGKPHTSLFRYPIFMNHNGVLKRINPILIRKMPNENIWFQLSYLPDDYQSALKEEAVRAEDLTGFSMTNKRQHEGSVYSNSEDGGIRIYVNDDLLVLPIVDKLLPSDGVNAYTVVIENGECNLKEILVCWGCHWSELFTGETKYGKNVFCLASDLSPEQREQFIDDIIRLGDVPDYLASFEKNNQNKKAK